MKHELVEFDFHDIDIDEKKAQEGVWRGFPRPDSVFQILIGHHNRPEFERIRAEARRKYASGLNLAMSPEQEDDIERKIQIHALAKGSILDWKGCKRTGKEIPYTVDSATDLLTRYPSFFQFVLGETVRISNFREQEASADEKNFVKP
jgi:hypothetical protein